MNTAAAITIGTIATLTPTVTCIIAYLFSRQDVRDLRAEFRSRLDTQDSKLEDFNAKFDSRLDGFNAKLDAKLEGFNSKLDAKLDGFNSKLDAKLDGFNAKLDAIKESSHKDALEIMRTMVALHERVAVVEAKQVR